MTRQEKLRHVTRLRDFHLQIQRYRSVIPAKAGRSAQRGEHPKDGPEGVSEANHPVPLALCKSLDPSFRWDDERLAVPARRADAFPRQQWAFAGMTTGLLAIAHKNGEPADFAQHIRQKAWGYIRVCTPTYGFCEGRLSELAHLLAQGDQLRIPVGDSLAFLRHHFGRCVG